MNPRSYLLLALLGLAVSIVVGRYQQFPGYLDSDYYFGGGMQLAQGKGFTEPYIWNYLADPKGLPHPSHAYWMPLASLIAAAGMVLAGQVSYAAARLGFFALAAVAPILTAAVAYSFSPNRATALISGLLAVFSIYYLPFMPVPDNYGAYLALGALFFLAMNRRGTASNFVLGLLAGLMSLARSDGMLWLGLAAFSALRNVRVEQQPGINPKPPANGFGRELRSVPQILPRIGLVALGYALVMSPWWAHNLSVHGTLMAPGGEHLLWLRTYDDTFAFPADRLTYGNWIQQGWTAIIGARLSALRWNLLNAFAAQGGIFLFPFIVIGVYQHRSDLRIQAGLLGWFGLLMVMTLVFPFAGSRGGFFHAGAGLQSLWWAMAPLGLDSLVTLARKRGYFTIHAFGVFRVGLVGIAAMMSAVIFAIRVLPGWGEGEQTYPRVDAFLEGLGATPQDVVMVRNPPGYYIMTGRSAIVVPYSDANGILAAGHRYHASFLVIEKVGAAGPIKAVYDDRSNPNLEYLGELDGTRIFRIGP